MESLKNVLANMLRDTLFRTHACMDSWCICNVIMIPSPTPSPTITHPPIIYLHFYSAAWGILALALHTALHMVHSNIEYT